MGIGTLVGDPNAATAAERRLPEANQMRHPRQPFTPSGAAHDITTQFLDASRRLRPGELVQDESFTLFEAVGALEIMDGKMDSGYVTPGDSFEADFDPGGELSPGQVIWIMDELLRLEILFHAGYPLSQNVFTSLHIFRLIDPDNRYPYLLHSERDAPRGSSLVHRALRPYCLAVLKSCELALECIQSQIYFEEEDFVTSLFGRELCPLIVPRDSLTLIVEAIAWVVNSDLDRTTRDRMAHRLSLRESMLCCFGEPLPLSGHNWAGLRAQFGILAAEENATEEEVAAAFSNKVQRQLAASTPPRPMPQLALTDAIAQWINLCDDAIAAQQLSCTDLARNPVTLFRSTWTFGYRKPEPTAFIRAKMQESLGWEGAGDYDGGVTDLLLADIRAKVVPGDWLAERDSFAVELPTDTRHRTSRVVLDFMSEALGDYINLYRMLCQNRSRMRRMLTQATTLWDELESKAEDSDEELRRIARAAPRSVQCGGVSLGPLSAWVRITKLQVCEWTVQLGFETDIYQTDELGIMYELLAWFAARRISHLEALQYPINIWPGAESYRAVFHERVGQSDRWRRSEILLARAVHALSTALSLLYKCLEASQLVGRRQHKTYYKMQEQYEARMKPFLGMRGDVIPDANTLYASPRGEDRAGDPGRLASRVGSLISAAQGDLHEMDDAEEPRRLLAVCIAVNTAVARLEHIRNRHGAQNDVSLTSMAEVIFPAAGGERPDDWWIVPEVRAKQRTSRPVLS